MTEEVILEPIAERGARIVRRSGGTEQDQDQGGILYLVLSEHGEVIRK